MTPTKKQKDRAPTKTKQGQPQNQSLRITPLDLERLVELDLIRTTEAAALNAYRWLGKGDPQAAHAAAVDAIRGTLDITRVSATVVFGDGLKPQANGIEAGEKLGNQQEEALEIGLAIIPIDGIELVGRGFSGAMSLLVAARSTDDSPTLMNVPCKYMEKIAYGPAVKLGPGQINLNASVRDNLEIIAGQLGKRVQDVTVAVLERKRHETLIKNLRKTGVSVRLINDGDVAAAMAPSFPNTGIDVYMGIGGSAEAVVAAAAIKCLDGDIIARFAPENEEEKKRIIEAFSPQDLQKQFYAEDMARGNNIIFCATGISDGFILRGIQVQGSKTSTSSVVMRARYGTVRTINAIHDLSRKTIRLRSANAEASL